MRVLILAILTLSVTACATLPSDVALCVGTKADRKAHAGALLVDGGPESQGTGANLLLKIKAGCQE